MLWALGVGALVQESAVAFTVLKLVGAMYLLWPGKPVLAPFLLLGCVFVAMTVVWLLGYSLVAARFSDVLTRPRVKAALGRVTGCALIGLGIRLALERR